MRKPMDSRTDEGRIAPQAEAVDDMEDAIDDAPTPASRRRHVGSASYASYDNPMATSGDGDDDFESVPLRGAGRSLAQRAQAHLKSLKKTLKDAFKDAGSSSSTRTPVPTSTYGNGTYVEEDAFVGSSPAGQMLTRHHARARSVDLRHVLGNLEDTLEGAATAATLLRELRDSGGDPDADAATNDALDLELSDVCEAHRAHLTQVAEMTDSAVSLSEAQLGTLLATLEQLNAAVLAIRSANRPIPATAVAAPDSSSAVVPLSGPPSLGASRIECATTEEEEAAMIAQAIAASLTISQQSDVENVTEDARPPPPLAPGLASTGSAPAGTSAPSAAAPRKQTTEDLLANLIDI